MNIVLATILRHFWEYVGSKVPLQCEWVKGHAGNTDNVYADRLANQGRKLSLGGMSKREPLGQYDEPKFRTKMKALNINHLPGFGKKLKRFLGGAYSHPMPTISEAQQFREDGFGTYEEQPAVFSLQSFTRVLTTCAGKHGRLVSTA